MAIANIYCTYLRALALLQNLKMYNLNVVIYGAQEGQGLFSNITFITMSVFKFHFVNCKC